MTDQGKTHYYGDDCKPPHVEPVKPAFYDKHPCTGCSTGYLECAQFTSMGLKCCEGCAHPTRWSDPEPYTADEIAEMKRR